MKKILLTGATGFIGGNLLAEMGQKYRIALLVRNKLSTPIACEQYLCDESHLNYKFGEALKEVDCVIHLAGRAHILNDKVSSPLSEFRKVNRDLTVDLAKQAAKSGVKRFIFVSTIGVNGPKNEKPFTFEDKPNPVDDYAVSKYEAELGLKAICAEAGMEFVIIRPPLVYGKSAPGNFGTLLKVAEKNLPLPLGAIHNQRSFVHVDNLVDLIATCIEQPNAANQIFLVSDDNNISTTAFLEKLTKAAGKKSCLLPVPLPFLNCVATLIGKKKLLDKLANSLTVDIEHTKKTLHWHPPLSIDESIRRCFKQVLSEE
ncbi:NAD-dependent epimerase/dehydratase family protein [Pseudoalteromonas xiamenensis]